MSEDPIGFMAGDANLYRYVGNSPVNGVDPSGLARPPKHFIPPTNPPQLPLPPDKIPPGWKIRIDPPDEIYPNGHLKKKPQILQRAVDDVESSAVLTTASGVVLVFTILNRKLGLGDNRLDRGLGDSWLIMEHKRLELLRRRVVVIAGQVPPTPTPEPPPPPDLNRMQPPPYRIPSPHGQGGRNEGYGL
jgi:hypothetical protein